MQINAGNLLGTLKQLLGICAIVGGVMLVLKALGVQVNLVRMSGTELAAATIALALAAK